MFRVKNTKAQGEIESIRRQPKLDKKWDNYYKQLIKYKEESEYLFLGHFFHCRCFAHAKLILSVLQMETVLFPKSIRKTDLLLAGMLIT
jgi:hypothetical protein